MKSKQRFLLIHGLMALWMIGITSLIHLLFEGDIFILAIGWAGLWFMSSFYWIVILSPLEISLGRLEGEGKVIERIIELHKKAKMKRSR